MLRSGIDIAVIALWMGHESTRTTMIYLKADLELKQRALDRTVPTDGEPGRDLPPDDIIDFLDRLCLSRPHHEPAWPEARPVHTGIIASPE